MKTLLIIGKLLILTSAIALAASGKNWTNPQVLTTDTYVAESYAAINANGMAAAIWAAGPLNNSLQVQASVRPAGGNWSNKVALTTGFKFIAAQTIAVAPNNDILAAWLTGYNPGVAQIAWYRNGAWSDPVTISSANLNAGMPTIAFDAQSRATVVWEQNTATSCVTQASVGTAPAGLGTPQVVMNSCSGWIRMAANGWGEAVVVSGVETGSGAIIAVSRDRNGNWGTPATLSQNQYLQRRPNVGLGDDGTAVVAFSQRSAPAYSRRSPAGIWSPVDLIFSGSNYGGTCNVAVDSKGNAVAAYDTYVYGSADNIYYPAFATYMPVNGKWSKAVNVMNGYTEQLEVAATPAGNFVVGWADSNTFSVGATTLLKGPKTLSSERIGSGWPFSLNATHGTAIVSLGGVVTSQIAVSTESIP
jgi:hypothetical protein